MKKADPVICFRDGGRKCRFVRQLNPWGVQKSVEGRRRGWDEIRSLHPPIGDLDRCCGVSPVIADDDVAEATKQEGAPYGHRKTDRGSACAARNERC